MNIVLQDLKQLSAILLMSIFGITGLFAVEATAQNTTDDQAVHIVKYADYQCPACRFHFFMLEDLKKEYGDKIEVISRQYPLNSHEHSVLAATAAEAARTQGKFHEMERMLYEYQRQWPSGDVKSALIRYAKQLDLDIEQFKKDLDSEELKQKVMDQKKEGKEKGVSATPTYIVEGEIIDYPRNKAALKSIIDMHLSNKSN